MPWRFEAGKAGDLRLALEWPRRMVLPDPTSLAAALWRILTSRVQPTRTRRRGLTLFRLKHKSWRGDLYVPPDDLAGVVHVDPANAQTWLREALAYAETMLVGRWRSSPDANAWIYEMHFYLALLVADELATRYLTNRQALDHPQQLDVAVPDFRKQIEKVWGRRARLTPRRLAMALVDAKFRSVRRRPLLDPDRHGIDDATVWRRVMRPARARRLLALRRSGGPFDRGWKRWRSLMYSAPRTSYCFFCAPGEEDVAARIWRALHS